MKRISAPVITILSALLLSCVSSIALEVTSTPVGFLRISVPSKADTYFSVGFHQPVAYETVVESFTGETITVAGTPNWTNDQFVFNSGSQPNTYFALIGSGSLEGAVYMIEDNDASSITLPSGTNLTGLKSNAANGGEGDTIRIFPYWTVKDLFKDIATAEVEIIEFDDSGAGINRTPAKTFKYVGTNWMSGATVSGNDTISPGMSMVIRNLSDEDLEIVHMGTVPMNNFRMSISTAAVDERHDIHIGLRSLTPMAIGDMIGLGENGDELLIFASTNAKDQKNYRAADRILEYSSTPAPGGWYDGITKVDTTFMLEPGKGYILRKAPKSPSNVVVWQGAPAYVPSNQ